MSPFLAERLHFHREGNLGAFGHAVQVLWVDGANGRGGEELDLHSLLDPASLWGSVVQPICHKLVDATVASAPPEAEYARSFATELCELALQRAMPLLRDPPARLGVLKSLVQSDMNLGSFRSLVIAVAKSSASHAGYRFRPWLDRCVSSDFARTEEGRDLLKCTVEEAAIAPLNRLQPVVRKESDLLLQYPRRKGECLRSIHGGFPFAEDLLALVHTEIENGWDGRRIAQRIHVLWPSMQLLGSKDFGSLERNVIQSCFEVEVAISDRSTGPVLDYLEAVAKSESGLCALMTILQERALLKTLTYTEPGIDMDVTEPAEYLLEACRTGKLGFSAVTEFAEASRSLHNVTRPCSAVWSSRLADCLMVFYCLPNRRATPCGVAAKASILHTSVLFRPNVLLFSTCRQRQMQLRPACLDCLCCGGG